MSTMIFVNLPVADLPRSRRFFETLGYTFNTQFSDDTGACLVISETICAMLLTHEKFRQFTSKAIADARTTTEVLTCLSAESRGAVDTLVDTAVKAGATEPRPPLDYGFMYGRAFDDLDGHTWEIMWMDPAHVEQAPTEPAAASA
ncbi:VOC family protein [Rhodoplanes roseus]|uniref:Glyoxalase n=1 Tax=Rhodoplanes roseus TaxID=29409 RepID=A0A327KYC5_9BRAD|nr:VOC family protein [Rhodoplanes roseus]RAI43849.1 glyoxalase [Rhodoplanes roseus]